MRPNYLFSFLFTLLLSACGSSYQAPVGDAGDSPRYLDSGRTHLVNDGETLYVIAWMYDLDPTALARANNLNESSAVTPGQVLSVDLRNQPVIAAATSPQAPSSSAVVTTNAVQATSGIQRAPLPGSGIARRELPSSRSAAPVAAEPAEPPLVATAPENVPVNPPAPAPAPVTTPPPVAVVETPQATPPTTVPPVQSLPPVQAETPVQTASPVEVTQTETPIQTTLPAPVPVIVPPPVEEPPASTIAGAQDINWDWPFRGAIVGRFSDSGAGNKGLDLAGNKGDPILAAAAGEVVYSGSGLLRYGDLIIIKHNDHFLSAYAHNSRLTVKEGDKVTRGQKIAELGSSGIDRNMLHFEIRLDGKPVDPQFYLPAL